MGKIQIKRVIVGAMLLYALPVLCEDVTEIPEAQVTASRTARTVDDALASVTVITRADIDRIQPQSVMDLLQGLAGIEMANTGGLGKATTLFLRGTNSGQLLVLIDGIRIGSVTLGTAAFEQIPVDQIERIEIVRGPDASLYGADAIGGVIQIFTRQGHPGEPITPSFSIGGGTYETWQGEAGVTGGLRNAWYAGSISGLRTNGILDCNGTASAGCFVPNPTGRDGYWSTAGSARAGYRFDDGASVSVDWLRGYGVTKFTGDFGDESHLAQQVLGTTLRSPAIGPWQGTLILGQSEDRSITDQDGITPQGFFNTQRNSASLQNDFTLAPRQIITVGGDYLDDHVSSDTPFPETSREDIGVFTEYQGGWGPLDTQLSARADHNQQFGDHYTGGAAMGYTFQPWLRLTGSFGTAFDAPSFDELYFPDFGNPNLRPEKSRSAELGVNGHASYAFWAVNAYQTLVDDLITFDSSSLTPQNIDRARIRGLETKAGWDHSGWRAQLNLTLLSPRDEGVGATHGLLLPRRAQKQLRLDLDRTWRMLTGGTSIYLVSRRYDDVANQNPLGGYTTIDFHGAWQFHPWFELQVKVANALNKQYQTAEYFNQLGRTVFVTLRYNNAASPR